MPASDQPKGAWDKNAFTPRQSVHAAFLRAITQDEAIFHQLPFDGLDGVVDTLICCRQKADERHCQQAGVQRIATVKLRDRLSLRVITPLSNPRVNLLSNLSPAGMMPPCRASAFLNKFHGAIKCHPCH